MAPPTVDRLLAALDTLEAHNAGVPVDDWEQAPDELNRALRRIYDLTVELSDARDALWARDQARRAVNARTCRTKAG